MDAIKVFISSNIDELKDERLIAKKAIEHFKFTSIMFEDFGARTETARKAYRQELKNSHVYLGIFYKEASKPTFEEYSKALKWGKDILIYFKKSEKRDKRLTKFVEEIKNRHLIYEFENVIELDGGIKKDLSALASRAYLKNLPPISKKKLKAETGIGITAIDFALDTLYLLELVEWRMGRKDKEYWRSEKFDKFFARNLADVISKMKVKITLKIMKERVGEALILTLLKRMGGLTLEQIQGYCSILYVLLTGGNEKQFLEKLLNKIKPFFEDSNKKL